MNISRTPILNEVLDNLATIPEDTYDYFQERQKGRLYDKIIRGFWEKEKEGFSRAQLARRMNKRPEQITRILAAPGNWTLDTISDLVLAIYGGEIDFQIIDFNHIPKRNYTASDNFSLEEKPSTEINNIEIVTSIENNTRPTTSSEIRN